MLHMLCVYSVSYNRQHNKCYMCYICYVFTVYLTTDNTTNVTCVIYVMCLQCYVMLCYVMLCYVTVGTVYIIYAMHLFKIYNYIHVKFQKCKCRRTACKSEGLRV